MRTYFKLIFLVFPLALIIEISYGQCPTLAQLQAGGTYSVIDNPCQVNVGTLNINNDLTLNGTGTLEILGNNGDINLNAIWTINSGVSVETVDGNDGDIDVNNGGSLVVASGASFTTDDEIDINSGGSIDVSGTVTSLFSFVTVDAGATATINAGGVLNPGNGNDDIAISGTLNVSGTVNNVDDIFVNSGGVLNVSSTGDVQITGDDLEVNGGRVNTSGNININGDDLKVFNGGEFFSLAGSNTFVADRVGNAATVPAASNTPSQGTILLNGCLSIGGSGRSFEIIDTTPDSGIIGSGSLKFLSPSITYVNEEASDFDCTVPTTCTGSGVLPVELIKFTVESQNNNGILKWTTASESVNSGFNIEKSADGKDWITLGFVEGHGTTNEEQQYSFTDINVSQSSFYRLKQLDFDGKFEYSPIVFLSILQSQLSNPISVYPNPTNGQVRLNGLINEVYSVSVYDLLGRNILLPDQMNLIDAQRELDKILPDLKAGTYILKFQNPGYNFTTRLIKI